MKNYLTKSNGFWWNISNNMYGFQWDKLHWNRFYIFVCNSIIIEDFFLKECVFRHTL